MKYFQIFPSPGRQGPVCPVPKAGRDPAFDPAGKAVLVDIQGLNVPIAAVMLPPCLLLSPQDHAA